LSASASLGRQEQWALPAVLPARGLAANGPVRLPKVHAALGFGLALLVLVVLGTVTQASIADLVAANASATRSVEALERLQALKGSLREFEASELATRVPGQPLERDSPHAAYLEMIRLRRELNELLDSGPQRQRLQQLAAVIDGATAPFRNLFGATPADRTAAAQAPPASAISQGLRTAVEAIAVIEREEREVLGDRQAVSASRARTAQVHVLLASVLGFLTIFIAGLMVRRDELERRKATDRLERANVTLGEAVGEAQRRGDEITRLSRLSHFLQGCRSPEEGCLVIVETAPALFGAPGALYLVSAERLDRAAAWGGGGSLQQSFPREDCWGMRQASIHVADPGSATPACPHLNGAVDATCIPLVADGNAFGLLVIAKRVERPDPAAARSTTLAAVDQISAGLANLRLRESLKVQSLRDPLTGLYNRRFLHDALSRECHDARRHADRPVALLLLDVDFFKRVNDTSGHAAGDLLLQALAELLGRTFRGGDIACRFGGEEFAMVLAETPIDVALRRAEALRLAIHGLHAHHGNTTLEGLTASIGVTAGSGDGLTPERLLHEADTALYEAKARGRDCCVAFSGAPGARPLPFDSPPHVY